MLLTECSTYNKTISCTLQIRIGCTAGFDQTLLSANPSIAYLCHAQRRDAYWVTVRGDLQGSVIIRSDAHRNYRA